MEFNAVMFDMDGLLINSERLALKAFQETCYNYQLGDQLDLYMQLLGTNRVTTESVLAINFANKLDWKAFLRQWDERYSDLTAMGVPLMAGVSELLDYLDEKKLPVAVATSTNTNSALNKLEQAGILHRFETVTGGDQILNGKPAPDIYLRAAKSMNVKAERCIALEDSANGIRAAVGAGMHAIQIPDLAPPSDSLLKLGHKVFNSLHEVIPYLASLETGHA